jgi:hypothetical protein
LMDDVLFNQRGNLAGGDWIECTTLSSAHATGFTGFRE